MPDLRHAEPCAERLSELECLIASDAITNGSPMPVTCGPNFTASSASVALSESMANRLRRQMEGLGSTLFRLHWKWQVTPLGRRIFQLAASARRTSDNDCGIDFGIIETKLMEQKTI